MLLESDFIVHLATEYLVAPVNASVLLQARALVMEHPLRALDAIQFACALGAAHALGEPVTFVSGDRNLLAVAATEDLASRIPTRTLD